MPYTTIKEESKENTTSSNKVKKNVRSSVHTASSQHTTMSRQRRAMQQQQQSEASVAAMTLGRRSQQLTCGGRRASMMSVRSAYDDDQLEKDIELLAKSYGIGTLSSSVACCDVTTTKQPLQDLENSVFQQSERAETDDVSLSDLPWGGRWLDFVGNVSIGGLKYAVSPTGSTTRRSVWMFLVVLGFGFMLYQIYERYVCDFRLHVLSDLRKVRTSTIFGFMLYQIYEMYVYNLWLHTLPDLRKVRLRSSASCSTRHRRPEGGQPGAVAPPPWNLKK